MPRTLDAETEATIREITAELRGLLGADVVCLALYGSAAGSDFVAGQSDVNVAIVLRRVEFRHLEALQAKMPAWRKRGIGLPLLLDRGYLERALDVFPMEFHDIQTQHRVLHGEDVFARLRIDDRHLRYQAEHELRGKLLRLRGLYADVGSERKRVEEVLLGSMKSFLIVMRNFLRLGDGHRQAPYAEVLGRFEERFGLRFPTMHRILRVRLGIEAWGDDFGELVRAYFDEVERLVEFVDALDPTPAHGAG